MKDQIASVLEQQCLHGISKNVLFKSESESVCHLMQMIHFDMCLWHFECSVAFCILCVQF